MEVDIKIYGIHERDFLIDKLKESLNLSDNDILYDDREIRGSCLYTLEKACKAPMSDTLTHRLVMPDDMIVCNDFYTVINKIINTHPDKIICLFPYCYHRHENEYQYQPNTSPYIRSNGLVAGNGLIFPVQMIEPMFEWIHEQHPDDFNDYRSEFALRAWIRHSHSTLINTIPAPVQHIGDDYGSHLPYEVTENRKTSYYRKDCLTDVNWESKDILDFPNYDYSFKGLIRDYILSGKGHHLDKNLRPRKR